MEIVCDLVSATVLLIDPEELGRFELRVTQPAGAGPNAHGARLGEVLGAAGVGRVDITGEALVDPAWVRKISIGSVGPDWETGFAGMCAYASSKGWLAEDGFIRGHVVWPVD